MPHAVRLPPRDAAALACVCANAASAYREGRWPRAVRVKVDGTVFEPILGAFDVTVAPGEDVQAAVERCPPGGCVLLLPGSHRGTLTLAESEVHIFGRGEAELFFDQGNVLTSTIGIATVVGLRLRREPGGGRGRAAAIGRGRLRLQARATE